MFPTYVYILFKTEKTFVAVSSALYVGYRIFKRASYVT